MALTRFLATLELQDPFYAGGRAAERNGAILAEHDSLFTQLERTGFADGQGQSEANNHNAANVKQDMLELDLLEVGSWCQT